MKILKLKKQLCQTNKTVGDRTSATYKMENIKQETSVVQEITKKKENTLIETYDGEYRVVGQDNSLPVPLFYGSLDDCIKWGMVLLFFVIIFF